MLRTGLLWLACAGLLVGCDQKKDENIVDVSADDGAMKKAIADARASLDTFEAELAKAEPGKTYAVKKPFSHPGGMEHMWLVDVKIVEGGYEGRLDNEPRDANAKPGERYTVGRDELSDWNIMDEQGRIWGGYTIRAMLGQLPADQRAAMEQSLQPLP